MENSSVNRNLKKRVGLVYFGKSREKNSDNEETIVNLQNAIEANGYECILYCQSDSNFAKKIINDDIDFALNYVPGDYGEDGRLSGFFETLNIPYSHTGVFHHCICINKHITKLLLRDANLDCPKGYIINREQLLTFPKDFGMQTFPFVIKPNNSGSSLNTFLIKDKNHIVFNPETCPYEEDEQILIEEYIEGREFTVSVFNGKAFGIIEVFTNTDFFDFQNKNMLETGFKSSSFPEITVDLSQRLLHVSETAFKAVNANSVARLDIRYNEESDRIAILEINTIPGMTPKSFLPKAFRDYLNKDFYEMIGMIIDDGFARFEYKKTKESEFQKKGYF